MSRKPNIRWRKRDLETLDRTVKNFNAKLSRLQKKNPNATHLPEKLSKKELKNRIKTRDDFNTLIDVYKSFSVRGAEDRVQKEGFPDISKWAYRQHEKMREKANKMRVRKKEKLLDLPVLSRGDEQGYTLGEVYTGRKGMHQIQEVKLNPITRDVGKMSKREFELSFKGLELQLLDSTDYRKKIQYKENYIKAMIINGYSSEMIDFVRTIPPDLMVDYMYQDDDAHITFFYNPIDVKEGEATLRKVWSKALGNSGMSKSEWSNNLKNTNLNDDVISSLFENVGFSEKEWAKILTDSGYSAERIKQLLSM